MYLIPSQVIFNYATVEIMEKMRRYRDKFLDNRKAYAQKKVKN